jgi:lysophospholipase L1-like esterase
MHIKQTDIVFLGDSLTESFDLLKHFGRNDLHNRGMSGNLTDHVLYRMDEVTKARPRKVFLMIGINDLYQGNPPDEVYHNIIKILDRLNDESPQTWRYLLSILPVNEERLLSGGSLNVNIYKMNTRLEEYCMDEPMLTFIDLHNDFLGMNGQMDGKYTYDGVHLTSEGYVLWANLIAEYLT